MTEAAAVYLIDTGSDYIESRLIQPDSEWVTVDGAADILCTSRNSVHGIFSPRNDYHQVSRKLRGCAGKLSPRGQGQLYSAKDLHEIIDIRRVLHTNLKVAAKVFAARRLGRI